MKTPEQLVAATIDDMTTAFARGDLDGILRTYEPDAVVVGEPGTAARGTVALRALFQRFIASKPTFKFFDHEVVCAEDLALHFNTWKMTGTAPDGSTFEQGGLSVALLRRQPTGEWRMVIDDPFGDWLLKRGQQPARG